MGVGKKRYVHNHILNFFFSAFVLSLAGKLSEGLFSALVQLGSQDYQSCHDTAQMSPPSHADPGLKALQLTEALRAVLEGQGSDAEHDSVGKQVSSDTAHVILKWLQRDGVSAHGRQPLTASDDRP